MKKVLVFIFTLALLGLGWLVFGPSAKQNPGTTEQQRPAPLKVGTNIWVGYEPLYLAQSLGFYQDAGIELVEFSNATQVLQAYKGGLIDVAALTLDEVFVLQTMQEKPKILLIVDFSNGADSIIAQPQFPDIQSLADKRIGVENTAMGGFFLARAFQASGLSLDQLQIIPLSVGEHEQAYLANRVDGLVTFDPTKSRLIKQGAHEVFNSSQIPGEIVDTLVANDQVIDHYRPALTRLVQGWDQAVRYIQEHSKKAAQAISKRLKVEPKLVLESYEGVKLINAQENYQMMKDPGSSIYKALKELPIFLQKKKLLTSAPETKHLLEPSLVQAVSQP